MAIQEGILYSDLKSGARDVLRRAGEPSNPGAEAEWIIAKLREKANLPALETYDSLSEDYQALFQNHLFQIITETGGTIPEPEVHPELFINQIMWLLGDAVEKGSGIEDEDETEVWNVMDDLAPVDENGR